jgi:flagellar hook-basal body complex protein FliE
LNTVTFSPITSLLNVQKTEDRSLTTSEAQKSFSSFLKDSIEKVNQTQIQSDTLTEKLALGQDVDLHDVMISSQKSSVTMQLTLEIRNKAVEAYQEMMRMQV